MDVTDIIDPLNDAQREAVTAPDRPTLVLAGAGSGKTRVLVHRVAWVIRVNGVAAQHVLAVTFTNKAAAEMRDRVEALLGVPTRNLWIGTFHGLSHRLLRIHWREAGLVEGFQIMDSEDQHRMVKRMIRALELDENVWVPKEIQWFINAQKDEGLRPKDLRDEGNAGRRQMIDLYARYEQFCAASSVIDFGELLLRSLELLRDNAEIAQMYQRRFQHVLVDEFQDTNAIQYRWLRMLAGPAGKPFVVGDDDQSIYRFRGSSYAAFLAFDERFSGPPRHAPDSRPPGEPTRMRIDRNFRSLPEIVTVANRLIGRNEFRYLADKSLVADRDGVAAPVQLVTCAGPDDEAAAIIERIRQLSGWDPARADAPRVPWGHFAVLYRKHKHREAIETRLRSEGIPYTVTGGLSLFRTPEIRDLEAALRVLADPRRTWSSAGS